MKKLIFLATAAPLLGFCLGCGPGATDTSTSDPVPTVEDTTAEIEGAMESGEIDPSSYGQESK